MINYLNSFKNNILDNLFYKEKLGMGNKATFIKILGRATRYRGKGYTRIFRKSGSEPDKHHSKQNI